MAKEHPKESGPTEADIWNAIGQFEKILEVMPNDRFSLETLADAYEKIGDHTRAKDYLVRYADVIADEADDDAAQEILQKLKQLDQSDAGIKRAVSRLEKLKSKKVMAEVIDSAETPASRQAHISAEISFAWDLLQAKKLSQEEYSMIVHDLSESSNHSGDFHVSTLHALKDRNFAGLNEIMAFAATACNTPMICLANFDMQKDVCTMLTPQFMTNRGAIVFETIANDVLVAILNPYDNQLKMDIEGLTGRVCHFFLAGPEDFDGAIGKIKKILAESAADQKKA
jgi:tetratricopeptide (TPR) repeat protein